MATFQAGKDAVFKLDNSVGAVVDITQYLTEIGFPQEPEQLESTTLGKQEKSYVAGFIGASVTLNGRYDSASGAIHDILSTAVGASGANAKRTFEFGPHGGSVGQRRYTGEVVVLSYEVTTGASDLVNFTANTRIDAAVTRNTF
jgi:hypothetical protein